MRDTDNVDFWPDMMVFVTFDLDAAIPTEVTDLVTDFADWEDVGALDGDAGTEEGEDHDEKDSGAWGVGVFHTSYRNYKVTKKFTALERNDTTDRLRYVNQEGDDRGVGKPERCKLAFVKFGDEGDEQKLVYQITKSHATVTIDKKVDENETDDVKLPFIATVYPALSEETGKALHWTILEGVDTNS